MFILEVTNDEKGNPVIIAEDVPAVTTVVFTTYMTYVLPLN